MLVIEVDKDSSESPEGWGLSRHIPPFIISPLLLSLSHKHKHPPSVFIHFSLVLARFFS